MKKNKEKLIENETVKKATKARAEMCEVLRKKLEGLSIAKLMEKPEEAPKKSS